MSCDALALTAMLFLASTGAGPALNTTPAPAVSTLGVAQEPLFAEIVSRARSLKADVENFRTTGALINGLAGDPAYAAFKARIAELAELDMKGHLALAARGTDGDLKCILRGISQDLPVRLQQSSRSRFATIRNSGASGISRSCWARGRWG